MVAYASASGDFGAGGMVILNWAWVFALVVVWPIIIGLVVKYSSKWLEAQLGISDTFFVERRRSKALSEYIVVRGFVARRWDIQVFLILRASSALGVLGVSLGFLIISGIIAGAIDNSPVDDHQTLLVAASIMGTCYLICSYTAALVLLNSRKIVDRFDNFEKYEAEIQRKFGVKAGGPPLPGSKGPA